MSLLTGDSLAIAYQKAKRWDKSLQLCERLLELGKKILGPKHYNTLEMMNYLAAAAIEAGKKERAIVILEEALPLFEEQFGVENYHSLLTKQNLAAVSSCEVTTTRLSSPIKVNLYYNNSTETTTQLKGTSPHSSSLNLALALVLDTHLSLLKHSISLQ